MRSRALRLASLFCATAGTLVLCSPKATRAQLIDQYLNTAIPGFDVQPGVTVASRLRPEYDYPGIRVGDFIILPELSESAGYDSNVTGTEPAQGSPFLETQATVRAVSDWGRDSLGGGITIDNNSYLDLPRQSYTNWIATLGGTYDIDRDVLSIGYAHLNLNQTSRDLDVPQLDSPVAYRINDLHASYKAALSALSLQPGIEITGFDYDNGTVQGVPYVQSYRDRVVFTPSLTASYEFAPLRSLVLVVRDSDAHYTNEPTTMATQNFNDISVLAGVNYDTGGQIRLRALVGYETRHFVSEQYATISAPIVEASAVWTPTGLTTITGTVARYIEDSASDTTVGYTETAAKLAVDHEYLRNVLLNATAGFYTDSYQQNQANQSYVTLGAGVTWLINRHMRLVGRYEFSSRQSNASQAELGIGQTVGGSYSENRFLLQLKIGL